MSVLDRELYSEAEAARLLGLPSGTLHYWLQGGVRGGTTYKPIIRAEPSESRWVTWAEFVEAGWLKEYRRTRGVQMLELRRFIERLRNDLGVPFPLAHERPLVSGRRLVVKAQEAAGLRPEFFLVTVVGDQILLTPPGDAFVKRVDWFEDVASAWRPHNDPESPVRVSPDIRFGRPSVNGVRTLVIYEHSEAGATPLEIAQDFGIGATDVRWALAYESTTRAA